MPGSTEYGHAHAEAFNLMLYTAKDQDLSLLIWNSRDGVTPFGMNHPDLEVEMFHHDWANDRYSPFHVPAVGDWIWVDLTVESATPKAEAFVERYWEGDGDMPAMKDHPHFEGSKGAAVAKMAQSWLTPGAPDLAQVDQAMHDRFAERARTRAL